MKKTKPKRLKIPNNHKRAINKFLSETDWDKFWENVYGCSRIEIENYRKVSAKSNFGHY